MIDRRTEKRHAFQPPKLLYAEFSYETEAGEKRSYRLGVYDLSAHGLGLLATETDIELVR